MRRGPNPVVEGLGFDIGPGRIFWVVGPNGAGKTSLLRVLAGLDRPRGGTVRRAPADPRAWRYFQSEMTLPASAEAGDWDSLMIRLVGHTGRTPLWPDVADGRRVGRLSTGERKRLVLDALLRLEGPLLLDEPYEHLSPDAKGELTRALEARARHHVVIVATNQSTERALRDGGIHLEAGVAGRLGGAVGVAVPDTAPRVEGNAGGGS